MKILQLNTWMGKIEGSLQRFLENNQYDIICMQEVMASPDRELQLSRLCFSRISCLSPTSSRIISPSPPI